MYREVKVRTKKPELRRFSNDIWLIDALAELPVYLFTRIRGLVRLIHSISQILTSSFSRLKYSMVSRMFWGRGSLYRTTFHIVMTGITLFAVGTGLVSSIVSANPSQKELVASYAQRPTDDFLQQGASIQSVVEVDPSAPQIEIFIHTVKKGENLVSVAKLYDLNIDTIRWANKNTVSPFSNYLAVGSKVRIPEMDGVLHKVKAGETVNTVASKYKGNRFDIIEINELRGPTYKLTRGDEIFVPNGKVPVIIPSGPTTVASRPTPPPTKINVPAGTFMNPLAHPKCKNYVYMRGFTGYHRGVDLSKGGGCPIVASAGGKVVYAGFDPNWYAGFHVVIDHGGGVVTEYWHGNGTMWVKTGDTVEKGQAIMQMGSTGNSTGVHLHLILRKSGRAIDPSPYIPY